MKQNPPPNYKHIQISPALAIELHKMKGAYSTFYSRRAGKKVSVTFERMLNRWLDRVGRFDPGVKAVYLEMKEDADDDSIVMDVVADQPGIPVNVESTTSLSSPEKAAWEKDYYFFRGGVRFPARPGIHSPFFCREVEGKNDLLSMIKDGWRLIDEDGREIGTKDAEKINNIIKEHQKQKGNI